MPNELESQKNLSIYTYFLIDLFDRGRDCLFQKKFNYVTPIEKSSFKSIAAFGYYAWIRLFPFGLHAGITFKKTQYRYENQSMVWSFSGGRTL